ncbi:MAG: Co2+/Mg2+ efflux protein ApaG [Candidatus Marinimicrobia bacterium]|nr:Co2+/Mg2+ efflux protein ApaG [Candidatus Neomarinimicrobiota bacterium]
MIDSEKIAEAITAGIKVQVVSKYIPEHTNPDIPRYFFAYWVTITNESGANIKLLDRHWEITDATGRLEVIDGEGVIGKQPIINAGASFSYNSFCPLETEFGMMTGHYQVKREDGHFVKIDIPKFQLISPFCVN